MRRIDLLAGAAVLRMAAPACAETLREALLKAYTTNPTLSADRANLRALDETVPIARASGLPAAEIGVDYTENVLTSSDNLLNPRRQIVGQPRLSVPLFSGGAVRNSVRAAETRVEGGRLTLRGTESQLFTAVVGAYMDVIRDEAIVSLNGQNARVLDINLQATRDRFQVGDLTRTDVAQSEARLARARSQLETAKSNLISSRENYIRLVGTPPGVLEQPPVLPKLPVDPDSAVDAALRDNPDLLAAQKNRDATRFDIDVARAGRLPQVAATGSGQYNNYLGTLGGGQPGFTQSGTSAGLGLSLSVPLFQGGRPAAQVRQAQARRAQAIEQVIEAERGVISQTRSAFAVWKSSLEVIAASEAAVSANRLSLEGVRAENSVGNRTILDILDAQQELLNSQVTLVTAQRDAYVASFALLAAMGRGEARDLGLEGGPLYDPVANYTRVRNRISDFGSDPEPVGVASSTAQTLAQGAEVTRPLDPVLTAPVDSNAPVNAGEVPKNR